MSPLRHRAALLGTVIALHLTVAPAHAAGEATGPQGQEVTVSETALPAAGGSVTVAGRGFDDATGIYVSVCVVQGAGVKPSPCVGGVDMTGASASSVWISSNPPAYGTDLAVPFGPDGTFEVTLGVTPDDGTTSCVDPAVAPRGCAIVTRADHTRNADRSADVLLPVTFDGPATPTSPATTSAPEPASNPTTTAPAASATPAPSLEAPAGTTGSAPAASPAGGATEGPSVALLAVVGLGVVGLGAGWLVARRSSRG